MTPSAVFNCKLCGHTEYLVDDGSNWEARVKWMCGVDDHMAFCCLVKK